MSREKRNEFPCASVSIGKRIYAATAALLTSFRARGFTVERVKSCSLLVANIFILFAIFIPIASFVLTILSSLRLGGNSQVFITCFDM